MNQSTPYNPSVLDAFTAPPDASDAVLLRVEDVAELTALSVRSVWRKTAAGDLPQPLKLGRSTRWRLDELVAYLKARAAIGGVR